MAELEGMKKLVARLGGVSVEMVKQVAVAVETSAIRVANHAKDGHQQGAGHAVGRYENQTGNLTESIIPELTRVDKDAVEATVSTVMEYAPKVEMRYPYMGPALVSQEKQFKEEVNKAIHGRN